MKCDAGELNSGLDQPNAIQIQHLHAFSKCEKLSKQTTVKCCSDAGLFNSFGQNMLLYQPLPAAMEFNQSLYLKMKSNRWLVLLDTTSDLIYTNTESWFLDKDPIKHCSGNDFLKRE